MERDDWYGAGASLGVHAALLVLFWFLTAGAPPAQPLGFVEVDLGPFAEGQPVQQAQEEAAPEEPVPPTQEEEPAPDPAPPVEESEPEEPAEESGTPVDLPDQEEPVQDEEQADAPAEEAPTPEEQTAPPEEAPSEPQPAEPEPEPEPPAEETGGAEEGDTGAESGEDAEGEAPQESAPYNIEGLNRDPIQAPLPAYEEKVNAVIKVRLTVDPQGRVVRQLPLMKGNPALERSVLATLERWRFNPLPAGAPQENQTGTVTFRFRLE